MNKSLLALAATLSLTASAHAVPILLGTQTLDFENFATGAVEDVFASPISDGDFRVDLGSVSTSIGGLEPASGSNFAIGLNNVQLFNDASWFLDVSDYADYIDSGNFGVSFSFLGDTNNPQASFGEMLLRGLIPDLSSPIGYNALIAGSNDATSDLSFDTSMGYQMFDMFRDDLSVGTRSLQLNVGIDGLLGGPFSDYALDDFQVQFFDLNTIPEPGSMAIVGIGLASLFLARRRRL